MSVQTHIKVISQSLRGTRGMSVSVKYQRMERHMTDKESINKRVYVKRGTYLMKGFFFRESKTAKMPSQTLLYSGPD